MNEHIEYIDEVYNTERVTQILSVVMPIIGANILNMRIKITIPWG